MYKKCAPVQIIHQINSVRSAVRARNCSGYWVWGAHALFREPPTALNGGNRAGGGSTVPDWDLFAHLGLSFYTSDSFVFATLVAKSKN